MAVGAPRSSPPIVLTTRVRSRCRSPTFFPPDVGGRLRTLRGWSTILSSHAGALVLTLRLARLTMRNAPAGGSPDHTGDGHRRLCRGRSTSRTSRPVYGSGRRRSDDDRGFHTAAREAYSPKPRWRWHDVRRVVRRQLHRDGTAARSNGGGDEGRHPTGGTRPQCLMPMSLGMAARRGSRLRSCATPAGEGSA